MRAAFAVLLACGAVSAQQAWHTTSFPVPSLTGWYVNGGPPPATYLTSSTYGGISMLRADGPTVDQEVRGNFRIRAAGGSLVLYLRATQNARLGVEGTFYALELNGINAGPGYCLNAPEPVEGHEWLAYAARERAESALRGRHAVAVHRS